MGNQKERFTTLAAYIEANGFRKNRVAASLGVRPQFLSSLLNPEVYRPRVSDELIAAIATLLNQSPDYVRRLYERAA